MAGSLLHGALLIGLLLCVSACGGDDGGSSPAGPGSSGGATPQCEPSYPEVCLPYGSADYDCAGGSGNGPNYIDGPVRVRHDVARDDPFDLDRDGDGIGCE